MDILVVAAHSDDEVLGCGGTISRHVSNGKKVGIVFMTDGVSSRSETTLINAQNRNSAAEQAAEAMGVEIIGQFDFPDNYMDSVPLLNIVQALEAVIAQYKPKIVYTHFSCDLNVDHRITHQAVMTACRPQIQSSVKEIYTFEVLSSSEWASKSAQPFLPQVIVDISEHWQTKMDALRCYHEEMRAFPHSRSFETVEALAIFRGATHGVAKAEAFFVERIIC